MVEPRYLEDKRPDIHAFFPDDRLMLDVLVLHPSSPSYLQNAAGAALRYRENEKVSAYTPLAAELGCRFLPIAFEPTAHLVLLRSILCRTLLPMLGSLFLPLTLLLLHFRLFLFCCRRVMPRCCLRGVC